MNDLSSHIAKLNASYMATAPEGALLMGWCDDLEHWAAMGITTPAEFDHHSLVAVAHDLSKEATGFKTDWSRLDKSSNEDLEVEIAYYRSTISERRAYIQEMEDEFKREQKEASEYYVTVLAKESTIGDGRLCDALGKLSL